MNETGANFLLALLVLGVLAISLAAMYAIIKAATLAALREHTVTSNMGVVVVKSVPLTIAEPSAESGTSTN